MFRPNSLLLTIFRCGILKLVWANSVKAINLPVSNLICYGTLTRFFLIFQRPSCNATAFVDAWMENDKKMLWVNIFLLRSWAFDISHITVRNTAVPLTPVHAGIPSPFRATKTVARLYHHKFKTCMDIIKHRKLIDIYFLTLQSIWPS